jgi:DNA-binding transcriptional LysR family regulator
LVSEIGLEGHLVDRTLEAAGCEGLPAYEVWFITTVIAMVESGLGVAVLPSRILLSTRHSRVETRLIGEPVVEREIAIVTRGGKVAFTGRRRLRGVREASHGGRPRVGEDLLEVDMT